MGNNVFQSPFNITSAAINAALAGATTDLTVGRDINAGRNINGANFTASATGYLFWSGRGVIRSPADASWSWRNASESIAAVTAVEANDILAQRNGTNAQAFRLYNTFTDASNYERLNVRWNSNIAEIGSDSAGTGTIRGTRLSSGGTIIGLEDAYISGASVAVRRDGTSGPTIFAVGSTGLTSTALLHTRLMPSINQASGTYCVLDINPTETAVGAGPHYLVRGRIGGGGDVFNVDRTGAIAGKSLTLGTGDFALGSGNFFLGSSLMVLGERADPGAPSANFGYLYCRDNGSGKTQIVARFPTGAVQVLATEP